MKYGRLILLSAMLAGSATPMFADQIYGIFSASGQGGISTTTANHQTTATGLKIAGTIGTTAGGNARPTGTVTETGSGVFSNYTESTSFFYHFLASGTPGSASFLFNTATPAGIEFLQITEGGVTMKFYITTVTNKSINTGNIVSGTTGGFTGVGYITFSNVFANGPNGGHSTTLYQEAADYSVDVNRGSGTRPLTVEIEAVGPGPVPEPSSLALLGTGMVGVAGFLFRKRDKA